MQTYLHDAAACLEALAVHDGRAGLVVLGLGDPHRLERRERREDGVVPVVDTQINLQAAKAGLERPVDFQAMDFCTHAY